MKDLTLVNSNERVDDLERKGYKLIQNPEVFCFGVDAVLLAYFAKVRRYTDQILDIGTGTGVIPLLMHARYEKGYFTGIDIQPKMVEMAIRSVKLNQVEQSVNILNIDIKAYKDYFKAQQFDVITCNPPYMKNVAGLKNEHDSIAIARHEVACTLEDIIEASGYMLKDKGRIYMIHRPHRLVDIISTMKQYKIEPKGMRMVYPKLSKAPTMVLIEGVKNGGPEMRVQKPLVIYHEDGTYTDEIYEIYDKKNPNKIKTSDETNINSDERHQID